MLRYTCRIISYYPLRFASGSRRFIDAYQKGLDGQQAAYHGHRVLPQHAPQEFDKAHRSSKLAPVLGHLSQLCHVATHGMNPQ
ncbi:hypothetical protein PAXRUDRAFT_146495 [Paxillus rubicundulus Ve08.2h10]|uniref:Uncharacterized protein n=1 Tax=Paxillus rubicundulus Ve08.2h10 TaxID=930991 RepID=A0A0D0DUM3_9AGAM|nr:hypothetical protein PAXRUDRAFT_146495 [Paxillus rubicundulus Ve08.2h10]